MREYYVYLLECCDGMYYIGVTNDLSRRILEHQQGFIPECFTFTRRPVQLLHYLTFDDINEAIYTEKKLKKWSRAKKKAYFTKNLKALHEKAKCMNSSSHLNHKPTRSSGAET